MNRVKTGIFSLTAPGPADDDGSYLRWHLLDHMPEQFQLPGIVHALRWIADGDYLNHRLAAHGSLGQVGNAVHYLVTDPVEETYDDFVSLGGALRENGRFPHGPTVSAGSGATAAAVAIRSACAHFSRGGALPATPRCAADRRGTRGAPPQPWLQWLHAEHYPALLAVPGAAGAWTFGSTDASNRTPRGWRTDPQYITVVYLDDDPLTTTAALAPLIEQRWRSAAVRPIFAGPLRTMISWEAWP